MIWNRFVCRPRSNKYFISIEWCSWQDKDYANTTYSKFSLHRPTRRPPYVGRRGAPTRNANLITARHTDAVFRFTNNDYYVLLDALRFCLSQLIY